MGIRRLLGRDIEVRDTAASPQVAVVNEAMVSHFWDGVNPVGRHFRIDSEGYSGDIEVVGLVQDAKYADLRDDPRPTFYLPYTQRPLRLGGMIFALRTAGDPMALVPSVRRAVQEIDSKLSLWNVRTQTQQIDETLMQERLFARLSSFFAALALLLACIGLYGTTAYGVARRTHEIGIRMALGGRAGDIRRMIMRETMALLTAGIVIGFPCVMAAGRLTASVLFGLKPGDPVTIAAATTILGFVAILAGYVPARRASRVDPMVALRDQ